MKQTLLWITVLALCLTAAGAARAEKDWYYFLPANQNYETDFVLKPGGSRDVAINSGKKMIVGFWTNTPEITDAQIKKYADRFPIVMKQKGTSKVIRSLMGSGFIAKPVDGEITLEVRNRSDERFQVVVYTQSIPF
jgi:hypothetical protein